MARLAKVYKIRSRSMNFPTPKFGILTFANHRLLVEDNDENAEKIKFIEKVMLKDAALGIFVDPKEETRDLDAYIDSREVQNSEVQAFLAQQNEVLPESATDMGAVNLMKVTAASTSDVMGRGAPAAHRFNAADVLRAKLAAGTQAQTPAPIPDSVQNDPSEVAKDAQGNPIADNTDPDALAKAVLNK